MAENGINEPRTVEVTRRRGGLGSALWFLLLLAVIIIGLLFATGFFSARVTDRGSLPKISIQATEGTMPRVDLESKQIVVGSKTTTVEVPTVETK